MSTKKSGSIRLREKCYQFFTLSFGSERKVILAILLISGSSLMTNGVYIYCKAEIAQWLLMTAWQDTLTNNNVKTQPAHYKPWPWADTWPVAKLKAPSLGQELIVLAGATGRTLAFAPGHVKASATPGDAGVVVIGGHRDTHFQFLEQLKIGDKLQIQNQQGNWIDYRVKRLDIVNQINSGIELSDETLLTLVTCYPFNSIESGGDLRYVVTAEPTFTI